MGYETRLYIGFLREKLMATDPGRYVRKIAMIEIDAPVFSDTFIDEKDKETPVYVFADSDADPDEIISDDKYKRQLYAIDPMKVQRRLLNYPELKSYPLAFAAAQLLPTLIRDYSGNFTPLVCILYGH